MMKVFVRARLRKSLAATVRCSTAVLLGLSCAGAAEFAVTNLDDSGPGSLREAMTSAIAAGGTNVITFNAIGTISLASSLPDITNSLTIAGPGPASLNISGENNVRIFHMVGGGIAVSLSGLQLGRGSAGSGGGAVLLENGDANTTVAPIAASNKA